jgi:hypothetical protein
VSAGSAGPSSLEAPVFAVVGRVNKGKSSIIATLAEDDSVEVSPRPGTTVMCREFPVRVDGELLFTLVDTPGFEEAARALAWLRAEEVDAAGRPARVEAFVAAHEGTEDFVEERRLLAPILAGASILYVVDGTKPYRANYEAEMEILRWTGRAGMALVNRIGEGDHAAEWRTALDQYFKIVVDFDAFRVTFTERMRVLGVFRELRREWEPSIERAVRALSLERARRRAEAAVVISELLLFSLSFVLELDVESETALQDRRRELEERFADELRKAESEARARIESLYGHRVARWRSESLERPVFDQDLFAERTWSGLGLTGGQRVGLWAAAGATVGGSVDAVTGGASMLAGAVLGGAIGAGVGLFQLGQRALGAGPKLIRNPREAWDAGRRFRVGPHAHPNFPFIIVDRALLHYRAVLARNHARRDEERLFDGGARGLVATLDGAARRRLDALFARARRRGPEAPPELRDAVHREVRALLDRFAPEERPGGSPPETGPTSV